MYYPNPWQTTKGCSIDGGCEFEMTVPWNGCEKVGKNGCSKSASLTAFFTNYTQVEEGTEAVEEAAIEASPLGSLQKGSIDIVGAKVEVVQASGLEVGIRIESPASLGTSLQFCL